MSGSTTALVNAYSGGQSSDSRVHTYESDIRTASLVQHLFFRARDARRPLMQQWKKNYRVLNGKMWARGQDPWFPAPEIPQMWPIVAARVAWMTDQRPIISVMPSAIPFSQYADYYQLLSEHMNVSLAATFSDNLLDREINKVLWDVDTYGIGYFKTVWEPWLADGLGDTVFRRTDPFTIYPDPWARTPSQLNYIIEAKTMSLDDLDRAFPGARQRIQVGFTLEADEAPHKLDTSVSPTQPRTNYAGIAPNTRVWTGGGAASPRGNSASISESPVVTMLECWLRTYTHEKPSAESLARNPEAMTRTIEKWRCIVVVGNCVLMDEPAENVNAYGTHPYDRTVAMDTGEWYGPCLVEMLTSAQESINRTLNNIEYNIALHGNPVLRRSPRTAARQKRWTSRPGQIVEAGQGEADFLQLPQMQPQIAVELVRFYKSEMEAISGMSAIVRGFQPSGRNAEGVLDSVQDAAFVRIRATLRELEASLKPVALKMAHQTAEFYTEPRLVSLLGGDGQRTALAFQARHFYVPGDEKGERVPMRFNLIADIGSQLATSRQARAAESLQLFASGGIDRYELLKARQWPNWHEVATRIGEAEATGAFVPPGSRAKSGRTT